MADGKVIIDTEVDTSGGEKDLKGFSSTLGKVGSLGIKAFKGTAVAIGTATTAVAGLVGASTKAYASYEQLVGGVDTLFKDASKKVQQYADEAYKTAGLSANDYMETVTSFSASLLQGLGGDTQKAAEIANEAVVDMSDNANKMGTSMQMIQNAYQGFAKQNYTMLDNLKLGYGGTQAEMARLINDSGVLGDSMEVTARTVNQVSFDKMIEAIHVVQTNLGITGTTSKEAATTIEGSVNSMKSAWTNLVSGMAQDDADIDTLINNFVNSVDTVGQNIIPRITQAISGAGKVIAVLVPQLVTQIPTILETTIPDLVQSGVQLIMSIGQGLQTSIPQLINIAKNAMSKLSSVFGDSTEIFPKITSVALDLIQKFATTLSEKVPILLSKGSEMILKLVDGIMSAVPVLIEKLPTIISTIAGIINDSFPKILSLGVKIIIHIAKGLISAIPTLIKNIPKILKAIVDAFLAYNWMSLGKSIITGLSKGIKALVPKIGEAGKEAVTKLVNAFDNLPAKLLSIGKTAISKLAEGIKALIGKVASVAGETAGKVLTGFKNLPKNLLEIGKNIVSGLWRGIKSGWDALTGKVVSLCDGLTKKIKKVFDIHSPSKVMKDQVGKNISLGIAVGIEENEKAVENSVAKLGNGVLKTLKTIMNASDFKKHGSDIVAKLTEGVNSKISNFNESIQAITDKIQASIDDVKQKQKDLSSALAGMGGELYTKDENGKIILSDLKKQTAEVKAYGKNLNALKGKISEDLMNEILGMNADEAYEFTSALLALSSNELKAYNDAYVAKLKASNKIAKAWYKEDLDELKAQYTTKVESLFTKLVGNVSDAGSNALKGFLKPFKNNKKVNSALSKFCDNVVETIKKKFDIHSPSRVFAEIGEMNALGLVKGFTDEDPMKQINSNIDAGMKGLDTTLNSELAVSGIIDYDKLAEANAQALQESGLGIKVDGREFGRLVRKVQ